MNRCIVRGALGALLLSAAGCDNMKHQSHSQPMDSSSQFSNGTSARTPPPHTVPQGPADSPAELNGEEGGRMLTRLPVPLTAALLARGRDRYAIYCSMCHGEDGYGSGIVVERGFPRPESFHTDRLRAAPVGQLYQAISRGVGVMYPLADRIAVSDRWAIVAYLRALQRSQHAALDDVPEAERAALLRP
jgi:mono/diheme cytochrome c family protein